MKRTEEFEKFDQAVNAILRADPKAVKATIGALETLRASTPTLRRTKHLSLHPSDMDGHCVSAIPLIARFAPPNA
jgi:hypothetical protein